MNKKIKNIILAIVVLVLIAINLILYIDNHKVSKQENELIENTENVVVSDNETIKQNVIVSTASQKIDAGVRNKVSKMNEGSRMKYYVSQFIEYSCKENYDGAYALLNENFRNTYFKDKQTFIDYFKNRYPKTPSINYKSVDRKGEIFTVEIKVTDDSNKNFKEIEESFVIREKAANNYTISFAVNTK